jgi:hypothetical protein
MATSTYLANPVVTVNSVALTDQCTSATINRTFEALEATAFGDTSRKFTAGLQSLEVTLTLYMSYAATETYATLNGLVGTTTNITIKPSTAALSATNPEIVITGCYLETLPVINATMGELSTIDVTFTGGTYAAVTAGP